VSSNPPTSRTRVLVADDEPSIRFVLRETLEEDGCEVVEAEDGNAALEQLKAGEFQLGFFDIKMPGPSGLELLDHVNATNADTAVVIITAQSTFDNAVEAMKRGAIDYLAKPFGIAEVKALTRKTLQNRALRQEVLALRREVNRQTVPGGRLIGRSAALLEVFKDIGRVAPRDVSVLITGESGTGKELVARAIHAASPRADAPFIAVNTAAVPHDLLESELFGHERGAFTGAVEARIGRFREAEGGTLFLDEIGDMPIDLQSKLLRVLQNAEVASVGGRGPEPVNVRIIAATHRDLSAAVAEKEFREDLLYRLDVVPIRLPALRDRPEDIPLLAEHFADRYAVELADEPRFIARSALDRLCAHTWPGNVRELENAVKRALVLSSSEVLSPDDFSFLRAPKPGSLEAASGFPDLVMREVASALQEDEPNDIYKRLLELVERPLIEAVLAHTGGNQIRAAALLGINRNTLRKKIGELGAHVPGRTEP